MEERRGGVGSDTSVSVTVTVTILAALLIASSSLQRQHSA